jgi:hypothetical protein
MINPGSNKQAVFLLLFQRAIIFVFPTDYQIGYFLRFPKVVIRRGKLTEEDRGQGLGDADAQPAPWETEDYLESEAGPPRHDGFTQPKRRLFLKALTRTGCILESCRTAGISKSAVYALQERDPEFRRHCELAIEMASVPVELAAWERGVAGVEEEVIRGGKVVGYRMKRSDSVLRLLLQGANPKKYGPRPGFTRKRLTRFERKRMEREIHAEIAAKRPTFDESMVLLEKQLKTFGAGDDVAKLESGWTRMRDGRLVPPGWTWTGDTGDEEHDRHGPEDG